ncbi:hypothetical protein NIES4071_03940 [Calothrix sp. NIES-4071]|nr:hypothetical protein NIES4071_03940 [Calothrix sp. NIES-4071]BAZ54740.1 hypothetical protein NIES4105_03930 [Calothrix sp. NIES-4105]
MNELTRDKKTILFIGTYTRNIGVAEELDNIKIIMRENNSGFDVESKYLRKVSDLFQNTTSPSPQIIHISGEGKPDGTLKIPDLDNEDKEDELRPDVLVEYFANNKYVNCVVLNFCYSKPVAELIAPHIQCVIGIDGFIQRRAAIEFSQSFYASLKSKPPGLNSVDEAFSIGQAAALDRSREKKYVMLKKQPEMQLIEPTERSNIPMNCKFSGNFSNLPEGASMWAYVNATLERKFYLVPIEDYYSNGTWQKEVIIGMETDTNTYRVGVLIADTEVTKTLNEDFSKLGILRFDNLPNGAIKFGDRAVKRQ